MVDVSSSNCRPDNQAIRELRDTMKELALETKESNKGMKRLTWSVIILTAIMATVGVVEFFENSF